jgi:hypothetical protein
MLVEQVKKVNWFEKFPAYFTMSFSCFVDLQRTTKKWSVITNQTLLLQGLQASIPIGAFLLGEPTLTLFREDFTDRYDRASSFAIAILLNVLPQFIH